MLTAWKESYDQPKQHIKKQRYYFANKIHIAKAMVFPLVIQMLELEHKERLSTKELMFLNCGAGEDSRGFLGQQGDPNSQF